VTTLAVASKCLCYSLLSMVMFGSCVCVYSALFRLVNELIRIIGQKKVFLIKIILYTLMSTIDCNFKVLILGQSECLFRSGNCCLCQCKNWKTGPRALIYKNPTSCSQVLPRYSLLYISKFPTYWRPTINYFIMVHFLNIGKT